MSGTLIFALLLIGELLVAQCTCLEAQNGPGMRHPPESEAHSIQKTPNDTGADSELISTQELQRGTALTRNGQFAQAIPHFLAARGKVAERYALDFNLALCYVGTGQFQEAIHLLTALRTRGHDNAEVNNLLAQAYVGNGDRQEALAAFRRAATITPANEKLYTFVADACMDHQEYAVGLQVVESGLQHVPNSAGLHYQRGTFLSLLDRFDDARAEFELAAKLSPESEIAYVAAAQENLMAGNIQSAIESARQGIHRGYDGYVLLTLLGEALIRSGVKPGEPEFAEAKSTLENAIEKHPNYSSLEIALGKLLLMENRLDDAIVHLQTARKLEPGNPAAYATLAKAYQRRGDTQKAQDALATLAKLNIAQAEKIRSAPGDRKASYGSTNPDRVVQ